MSHADFVSSALASSALAQSDPAIFAAIQRERDRQEYTLELIASENHTSPAVMEAQGSCLTNKYAEGYPGKRYYGGCQFVDEVETLAIERAKQLFGCKFANVQPHSGSQANQAVFFALLTPGDTFASLVLADGGHLTHGRNVNVSGKWFKPVHYPLVYDRGRPDFERIDYAAARELCLQHKPKILICGYSAYPRQIDFAKFRDMADECGAILMADIAHIAGLVAGGAHPSPFPHCHVVTTTTHKTLRGPRSGLILTNDEDLAKKFDKAVFPGLQGGPLMHVIAGKAVCFGEALKPEFKQYAQQVVANAKALAASLMERGFRLVSGGTENHLMLIDLPSKQPGLTGADAEVWLQQAGIITNKNGIPQDPAPPMVTSGLRLGTPAITTRGLREVDMPHVAELITQALLSTGDEPTLARVRADVRRVCEKFPLHAEPAVV